MYIAGIGTVFNQGRGIEALQNALAQATPKPEFSEQFRSRMPLYPVDKETLKDKGLFKKMRRADRFNRMAVMAAVDAHNDSSLQFESEKRELGVIVSSALGPHATTFKYIDGILEYGDNHTSPTQFTHSVHNITASYINNVLECRGPTFTVSQFALSLHHALIQAAAWLAEGRCKHVLVGAVDELSTVMEYIVSEKTNIAKDGYIRPFTCSGKPVAAPGEGSVFLLLTYAPPEKYYAEISAVEYTATEPGQSDVLLLDCDGMAGDESLYLPEIPANQDVASYTPLFGSTISNTAFNVAAGVLMLRQQYQFASPNQDNPHGLNILTKSTKRDLSRIACLKRSNIFKNGSITLER
ncbi:MAG: beta-ketoacyl synthase N-terminal-like domain-containing protein [Thermodesulfobacteriota bacterium]